MNIQNPEQFIKENPIDKLDINKAKEIYDKLVDDLNYHNYLYYVKSQPVISDYEYDLLFHYLEDLEKKFSKLIFDYKKKILDYLKKIKTSNLKMIKTSNLSHNLLKHLKFFKDKKIDITLIDLERFISTFSNVLRLDSPTQRLTNQVQSELKKAKHKFPLLSLENTYDVDEVAEKLDKIILEIEKSGIVKDNDLDWQDDISKISTNPQISFYIEPKYDGLSIELIYENGFFQQAITRWNGFEW